MKLGRFRILQFQNPKAFVRENVPILREHKDYLGLEYGEQERLVLAWCWRNVDSNRFATTILALQRIVDDKVHEYKISPDGRKNHAFILCPDARYLRGRFVTVEKETIYFEFVSSVQAVPFYEDVNQHKQVTRGN